jgi:hypothetical protein
MCNVAVRLLVGRSGHNFLLPWSRVSCYFTTTPHPLCISELDMEWGKLRDRYPNLPREQKPFQVLQENVLNPFFKLVTLVSHSQKKTRSGKHKV